MSNYQIKPLEWNCDRPHGHEDGEHWHVSTVFGSMQVNVDDGRIYWGYCFDEYYDEDHTQCDGVEEGKRLAEEFYLSRLMPALQEKS